MCREIGNGIPSLLESAIVFNTYVTMCMCVCVCVCMQCIYRGQSYGTLHVAVCNYVRSVCVCIPLSLRKESLQKEAIRSMPVKIFMINTSLVNGTSNATQMCC